MSDHDALMHGPAGAVIAQETLELMRLHGVPATSANYEVWLDYRLGRNAALREAIDAAHRLRRKASPPKTNDEFYERFFTGMRASAQMVLAGEQIARDLEPGAVVPEVG